MKWTSEQVEILKKLCFEGKSNGDIAKALKCHVNDVYAKRSQLGITIPKVKAAQQPQKSQPTKRLPIMEAPRKAVEKAFENLDNALLLAVASDWTSEKEAKVYSDVATLILEIKSLFKGTMQKL